MADHPKLKLTVRSRFHEVGAMIVDALVEFTDLDEARAWFLAGVIQGRLANAGFVRDGTDDAPADVP